MFHTLRLNIACNYLLGSIFMMVSFDEDNCMGVESRHLNIALSTLQQFFFGALGCFVFSETLATFRAITSGVIGGKTTGYVTISYGLPLFNIGLTMLLYGDDFGKDPRCFIGWENETKNVFFYQQLTAVTVSIYTQPATL